MKFLVFFLIVFSYSCKSTPDKNKNAPQILPTIAAKKETKTNLLDTLVMQHKINDDSLKKITKKKYQANKIPQLRIFEGPGMDNINGKPLTEQVDIASKIVKNNPDTIKNIAKKYYMQFANSFPKSISDDFEQSISHEEINYPILHFRIQLFENEFAIKPYSEKQITVKRETSGALTTQ